MLRAGTAIWPECAGSFIGLDSTDGLVIFSISLSVTSQVLGGVMLPICLLRNRGLGVFGLPVAEGLVLVSLVVLAGLLLVVFPGLKVTGFGRPIAF